VSHDPRRPGVPARGVPASPPEDRWPFVLAAETRCCTASSTPRRMMARGPGHQACTRYAAVAPAAALSGAGVRTTRRLPGQVGGRRGLRGIPTSASGRHQPRRRGGWSGALRMTPSDPTVAHPGQGYGRRLGITLLAQMGAHPGRRPARSAGSNDSSGRLRGGGASNRDRGPASPGRACSVRPDRCTMGPQAVELGEGSARPCRHRFSRPGPRDRSMQHPVRHVARRSPDCRGRRSATPVRAPRATSPIPLSPDAGGRRGGGGRHR
jgi:hypothetical protein